MACCMTKLLVAASLRGPDLLDLHWSVPFARRCDDAAMSAESDQISPITEHPPTQMAEIVLIPRGHLGRRRISDMRVVSPDNSLAFRPVVIQQVLERLEHVGVAQVP